MNNKYELLYKSEKIGLFPYSYISAEEFIGADRAGVIGRERTNEELLEESGAVKKYKEKGLNSKDHGRTSMLTTKHPLAS